MKPKYKWLRVRDESTGIFMEELFPENLEYWQNKSALEEMPYGWYITFGESFVDELNDILLKHNYAEKYRLWGIRLKFGILRLCDRGVPPKIRIELDELVKKYGLIAAKTCVICGKPGEAFSGVWGRQPYCKEHAYMGVKESD